MSKNNGYKLAVALPPRWRKAESSAISSAVAQRRRSGNDTGPERITHSSRAQAAASPPAATGSAKTIVLSGGAPATHASVPANSRVSAKTRRSLLRVLCLVQQRGGDPRQPG